MNNNESTNKIAESIGSLYKSLKNKKKLIIRKINYVHIGIPFNLSVSSVVFPDW